MPGYRKGFTLVELLVVLAILAVLLGLLIPAVQKVREMAARIDAMNRMRQIGIATAQYADDHGGVFPSVDGRENQQQLIGEGFGFHTLILPYVEQGAIYRAWRSKYPNSKGASSDHIFEVLLNPADYSIHSGLHRDKHGADSVASNAVVFKPWTSVLSVRDGLSNTILHAQHLAYCHEGWFRWLLGANGGLWYGPGSTLIFQSRPTFADAEMGQVVPVMAPDGSTRASVPGRTFQVRPKLSESDFTIPQTPHSGGMPVVMGDGSVRVLSPGVSETTFWSAVTPAGGEVPGSDW